MSTGKAVTVVSALLTDTGLGEIPDARMLVGVREFQPSLQPEGGAKGIITQLMSLLKDKSGPAPPPAMIASNVSVWKEAFP